MVGDDPIHSPLHKPFHVAPAVHSPDKQFPAVPVNARNIGAGTDEQPARANTFDSDRQFANVAWKPARHEGKSRNAGRNGGKYFHSWQGQGEDDDIALHFRLHNRDGDFARVSTFDFDKDTGVAPANAENLGKRRDGWVEAFEFGERLVANPSRHATEPVESVIVKDNEFPVARLMNIHLDEIHTKTKSSANGGHGVFDVTTAESAMCDDVKRTFHSVATV